jgi:hypothetical protein
MSLGAVLLLAAVLVAVTVLRRTAPPSDQLMKEVPA